MSEMKWPLSGYAPGRYTCACQVCGDQFEGDKRAYQCLACATKSIVNSHASLVEENARLREALTPSGETKAAYLGGFRLKVVVGDDDGEDIHEYYTVPWTTIKEIMAAIKARAEALK